jgi:hypothetical protein
MPLYVAVASTVQLIHPLYLSPIHVSIFPTFVRASTATLHSPLSLSASLACRITSRLRCRSSAPPSDSISHPTFAARHLLALHHLLAVPFHAHGKVHLLDQEHLNSSAAPRTSATPASARRPRSLRAPSFSRSASRTRPPRRGRARLDHQPPYPWSGSGTGSLPGGACREVRRVVRLLPVVVSRRRREPHYPHEPFARSSPASAQPASCAPR